MIDVRTTEEILWGSVVGDLAVVRDPRDSMWRVIAYCPTLVPTIRVVWEPNLFHLDETNTHAAAHAASVRLEGTRP
jgi:hypothetical protein